MNEERYEDRFAKALREALTKVIRGQISCEVMYGRLSIRIYNIGVGTFNCAYEDFAALHMNRWGIDMFVKDISLKYKTFLRNQYFYKEV